MAQEYPVQVKVHAVPDANEPHGIKFWLDAPDFKNGKLVFKNIKKGDTYRIAYDLVDGTMGLKFAEKQDAIWATLDDCCPEKRCHLKQYEAKEVSSDGKQLVVKNKNAKKEMIHYTLNFTKPGQQGLIPFDPVTENQNGGDGYDFPWLEAAAVGAGAAIVAVLAALRLRRGLDKDQDPRH